MKFNTIILTIGAAVCILAAAPLFAVYVIPRIGGGQTVGYPMIMPEIFFDGYGILIYDEDMQIFPTLNWYEAPVLRALVPPAEFDPAMPWSVLTGKAYNYQYGWDSQFLDEYTHPFPPSSGVWIKVLEQSNGLETYYRDGGYAPIFGTKDPNGIASPDIWYWNKGMRHNTYAVQEGFYGRFSAVYKVYLGNILTGNELVDGLGNPLYESSIITQRWMYPCPYILHGDVNSDCITDLYDFTLIADRWLSSNCSAPGWCDETDVDHNGAVGIADAVTLSENWLIDCLELPLNSACTPR